ncbi:MAG: ABC transporter permease [Dehalococcoidia bacterium]|nr:ABC transporter permease [Dehalococcoidia bacterium]
MRDFILRRLLLLIPLMLGVSFLTFAMFRLVPGDASHLTCGFAASPECIEQVRHDLGLDRPWYEQYGDWLGGVVQGDFGHSFFTRLPVSTEIDRRLPVTGELLIMTVLFSLLLGIPPGVLSAIRPGTALDHLARVASVLWLSVPAYWLGILAIAFILNWFGWVPPQFARGYVPFFDDPWVNLQQFLPPSLVMALGFAAGIMRLTRSSLLEVMRNDYIRTAWSKGLRERTVVIRHALRNALIPVVTVIGLQAGALIGGAVIIESVFNLNGLGKYALEAILRRDLMVVQSVVLIFAMAHVLANLAVDVAYVWLDPRIRYA